MAQTDAERLAEIEQQCVILSDHLDYLETDEPEVRTVAAIRATRLVVSALTQLLKRVRELEADRARLDALEHFATHRVEHGLRRGYISAVEVELAGEPPQREWTVTGPRIGTGKFYLAGSGPTLRDAIDAARARESGEGRRDDT